MLVYEKIVDGVKHLYGTLGNVPSDDDTQLSYKDEAGKEISDVTTFKLFYGTPKLMKASLTILPTDDDTTVNVLIGDVAIIGEGGIEPQGGPGIYYYDEQDEPYLAMTWDEVKETYPDAFVEVEGGLEITGYYNGEDHQSYFRDIETPFKMVIGDDIVSIGDYALNDCSLKSVTIPDSVTDIGEWAFWGCSSLTNVTIPNSVTSIGNYAFSNCSLLTSIAIPDTVTSIGSSAFNNCKNLKDIWFGGTKEQWNSITKGPSWAYNTGSYVIHCTDGDIPKQ